MAISGCSTITKEVPVHITEVKVVTIPPELLTECVPSPPPNKETYISSDYMKKEDLLTNYCILLLNDIKTCNDKIAAIKSTSEKQKNIYKTIPSK